MWLRRLGRFLRRSEDENFIYFQRKKEEESMYGSSGITCRDKKRLKRRCDVMVQGGPDDERYYINDNIILGCEKRYKNDN